MPDKYESRLPDRAGEAGVGLIEIVIALSILATVLVALGGIMFQVARHTRQSAAAAYRSAAITSASGWIQVLPWDSLDTVVGCTNDSSGQLAYSKCVTVQNISSSLRRVTIAISSTGALVIAPDTVVVDRTKPRLPSTLNTN